MSKQINLGRRFTQIFMIISLFPDFICDNQRSSASREMILRPRKVFCFEHSLTCFLVYLFPCWYNEYS